MKKHILHTLGLAAMAALLCVFCGDNSTNGTPGGEVNELLSKYNKRGSGITYTVTFDANGGSGAVPDAQSVNAASGLTLPDRGALTKDGFAFGGWNTEADGSGTLYSAGSSYSPTAHSTLYAVWNHIYTITFHANGGSGTVPSAATVSAGNSIQLPDGGGLSNGDLVFSGWNTEADGSGATRSAGSSYSPDGNITLYATWREASTGDGDEPSIVLADGEAWVYNDSGYIFTADNRLIKIFKYYNIWWYGDTEYTYETSGIIITINSVSGRYTISGNTLLLDGYTSTFTKTNVNPQIPYSLTTTKNISSSAITVSRNPDQQYYQLGTVVTLTALSTDAGLTFTNWTGASTATTPTVQITMDGNKTLTANFTVTSSFFTDSRDGTEYKRVAIGNQVWMAENLNYDIPNNTTDVCYGSSADSCAKYGRLYNWSTAMNRASSSSRSPSGVQGVCPVGWHIPSDAEWTTLVNYVGDSAGKKLKSTSGWDRNGNGTDDYGWSALPGGYGDSYGKFSNAGIDGSWWSTTVNAATDGAWRRFMGYYFEDVNRSDYDKSLLFSVRCAQD